MKTVRKIEQNQSVQCSRLRVAAYCRVSTDYDAQLESLETQKSHYENYIRLQDNWELAGIYFDEGISGTRSDSRPELQRLMADCRAGKIDYILTKSISRFSRNTTDCIDLVRSLLRLNIPIYFEKENLNTGSMEGELILSILSSMAEDESRSISNNSKWSLERRFLNGTFKSSSLPYGYKREGEDIVIIPDEAEIIKRIFAEALAGKGAYTIAKGLNSDGVPPIRKNEWSSTTVFWILRNEFYIGDAVFQKTFTDESFSRHLNKGYLTRYRSNGHHEAIISRADFEAVAFIIAQRASEKGIPGAKAKFLDRSALSGKIVCGECGGIFKHRIHHSLSSRSYAAWCCSTHLRDKSRCSMKFVRDETVKFAFLTMMNKLIFAKETILMPYLKALKGNSENKDMQRISALEQQISDIAEQQNTITMLMAQGCIDQVLFNQENNELKARAARCRTELNAIKQNSKGECAVIRETSELIAFASYSEMLADFSDEVFSRFVNSITTVTRNEISFELKCGLTLKEEIE